MIEESVGTRRPEIEAWLDERKVTWVFEEALPVADIDRVASLANQARLEPLDEDVVDRYAADMERGDVFPPIVVRRDRKRLVLIGGNHRVTAAGRAGIRSLPAYVIDAAAEMALRLTYEDNRRHGLPPSEEERLFQAAHLIANGYSQTAAASTVGLSTGKVQRFVSVQRTDERAKRHRIKGWEALPKSSRWRLGEIRSDPVFAEAARLATDGVFTSSSIFELCTRLNAARSEEEAFAVLAHQEVAERAKSQTTAGGMVKRATPRSKLLGALSSIAALEARDVASACATSDQRADLAQRITAMQKHLGVIRKELT